MRYFLILLSFFSFQKNATAQDSLRAVLDKTCVREKPKFPGGEEELKKFLALNLRYPTDAISNNIEGEVVVSFKIDANGNVTDIVPLKSLGHGCDEEAVKVVKKMPQWTPAKRDGRKVAVIYNLPIVFELPK